jgi:hypothetical protein
LIIIPHLCIMKYIPIECALHDRYLAFATTRTLVAVEYRGPEGQVRRVSGVIGDVYTANDSTEWMLIADERIRLDWIQSLVAVS